MSGFKKSEWCFEVKWPQIYPMILKYVSLKKIPSDDWIRMCNELDLLCHRDSTASTKLVENIEQLIRNTDYEYGLKRIIKDECFLKTYLLKLQKFLDRTSYLTWPYKFVKYDVVNQTDLELQLLNYWQTRIYDQCKERLQEIVMKIIDADRNGEPINDRPAVGVRRSYVLICSLSDNYLDIYRDQFESVYLKKIETFYTEKIAEQKQAKGLFGLMKYVHKKLYEEEVRGRRYLDSSSYELLRQTCSKVFIEGHLNEMLPECANLITKYDTEHLNIMFKILNRLKDGIEPMLREFENHIRSIGSAHMHLVCDIIIKNSGTFVEDVVKLYKKFEYLVKNAFEDDKRFGTALDKTFMEVINDTSLFKIQNLTGHEIKRVRYRTQPKRACGELFAHYYHTLLRRNVKGKRLTHKQIDNRLKDSIMVLKCLSDKDLFLCSYKSYFVQRVILGTSAKMDREQSTIDKFQEVGMPIANVDQLTSMFWDIKISKDLSAEFSKKCKQKTCINFKLLHGITWTHYSGLVSVSLPSQLEEYASEFEEFYKSKYSGRKLQWFHHISNGTISFVSNFGQYDLNVTTFQMSVLFAWNQRPDAKISYESLRLATELPDPELRHTLWSLVASPRTTQQILNMEPVVSTKDDFTSNILFEINPQFHIVDDGKSQRRGKLNLIGRTQLSTERSITKDNKSIIRLRVLRIQEAIIKIMKLRKRMNTVTLQAELIDVLKNIFLPSKKMVGQQLGWLVTQKLLRRDDNDSNTYIYMA